MTVDQARNLGMTALWALVGALVATGLHLAQVLQGTDIIAWRPLAATFTTTFFGALATALGLSFRPRIGSEALAGQVDQLRREGVPRSRMVVLPDDEAALALALAENPAALADEIVKLSPADRAALLGELERRIGPAAPIMPMTAAGAADVLYRSG